MAPDEPAKLYEVNGAGGRAIAGVAGVDGESYEQYAIAYSGGPDVNPQLSGRAKYAVYAEMRRSDPAVRSLLSMFKLPVRSAIWDLEPPSEDPGDLLRTEALAWQFGLRGRDPRLDLTWSQQIAQAFLMLDWGAMFEELIWGAPEPVEIEDQVLVVRPLLRCAPRSPSTVQTIGSDNTNGTIRWLRQDIASTLPIPGEKLAWYVLDKEGQNWYGTSLLRYVFGPWRLKRALMISSAIAWDRWASGIPFVRHPETDEGQERATEIGRNVRTHERAYVAMPSSDQWDFSIESTGQISDPTPLLHEYDDQIAKAGLQHAQNLGRTSSGSRALGEVQERPYYLALQTLAEEFAASTMKRKFRPWMDVNFGTQYPIPRLTFSRLSPEDVTNLAAALANLSSAGFTFADRDTQDDVRERFDLPPLPDDLQASLAALPPGVVAVPAPPSIPMDAVPDPTGKLAREGAGLGV